MADGSDTADEAGWRPRRGGSVCKDGQPETTSVLRLSKVGFVERLGLSRVLMSGNGYDLIINKSRPIVGARPYLTAIG